MQSVAQNTNGISVTLGTPPNTNTTYSAMSVSEGQAGTATSLRTMRADYLKQIIQYYAGDSISGIRAGASGTSTNTSTTNPYIKVTDDGTYQEQIRLSGSGATSVSSDAYGHITIYSTNSVTGIRAGASGTTTNASTSNPYIKVLDDNTYQEQIRLSGSGATSVSSDASGNVTISSTNTVYSHPSHTARTSGLYKITVNTLGHVTGATAVAKSDITALGIPAQDTVYSHPTTDGNKHIPTGGSTNQILR